MAPWRSHKRKALIKIAKLLKIILLYPRVFLLPGSIQQRCTGLTLNVLLDTKSCCQKNGKQHHKKAQSRLWEK
ncbi:MAG: hypothetical protein RBR49_11215 [Desulfovibrio desulfuricans]|nr:hypothetical protein [Desulfovibrio desulfuricans]